MLFGRLRESLVRSEQNILVNSDACKKMSPDKRWSHPFVAREASELYGVTEPSHRACDSYSAECRMLVRAVRKLAIHGGQPVREKPYPASSGLGERENELLREVLASEQWGGYHDFVGKFEQLFAQLHDCEHGVAAANGTLALEMALEAAGIREGDEVIVPAHSFVSTASAVSRMRAVPVFVDIGSTTYNIDPERVAAAITDKTKGVIVVHFGGQMADMDSIQKALGEHDVMLIEDAAHAHGAEWHGRRAGSVGICGVFSFQNSKAMSAGEGGILTSNDEELASRARSLANHGRREEQGGFHHFTLGSNYRLTGLQAAILLAQLERLPEQIRLRQENATILIEQLKTPGVHFQKAPEGANVQTLHLLVGRIDERLFGLERNEFVHAMNAEGIPCRPFYPHPLYKNPMYEGLPHRVEPCPVAEQACRDSFWLPQQVWMGNSTDTNDVRRAIEKIHEVYKPQPHLDKVQ